MKVHKRVSMGCWLLNLNGKFFGLFMANGQLIFLIQLTEISEIIKTF